MTITHTTNSWPVIPGYGDPRLGTYPIPGAPGASLLTLDLAAPLFVCVALDWHHTVHAIPRSESYDPRTPDSSSNHRSGTACDFNSDVFPQHVHRMTARQKTAVHAILAKYVTSKGVRILEWGGDWHDGSNGTTNYLDEMHVQLSQEFEVTPAMLADCIHHMGLTINGPLAHPVPHPVPVPTPDPIPAPEEDDMPVLVTNPGNGQVALLDGGQMCRVADDDSVANWSKRVGPPLPVSSEDWQRMVKAYRYVP